MRVCVTFVVFSDCESCTRPISTNPGSMEAGGYGLARGTCCVARRLDLVAVAGLMWISWYVLGAAGFFSHFFVLRRRHTACCTYEATSCLIYLSTSIIGGCYITPNLSCLWWLYSQDIIKSQRQSDTTAVAAVPARKVRSYISIVLPGMT